jgi:CYTH domain-containing protein
VPAEIERKFLLAELPEWLGECESKRIEQGYLALEEGVEVRLRAAGEAHRLTVKRGAGRTREEVEVELDRDRFDALWPLTEGRRVVKRRHLRPVEGGVFEIDVYEGDLDGLAVVEIEFGSEEAADGFSPPEWVGAEVTDDARFANRALAVAGAPER